MKTQNCRECRHYDQIQDNPCTIGHKPRYYIPRKMWDAPWGYRKKCADFEVMVLLIIKVTK